MFCVIDQKQRFTMWTCVYICQLWTSCIFWLLSILALLPCCLKLQCRVAFLFGVLLIPSVNKWINCCPWKLRGMYNLVVAQVSTMLCYQHMKRASFRCMLYLRMCLQHGHYWNLEVVWANIEISLKVICSRILFNANKITNCIEVSRFCLPIFSSRLLGWS